VLVIKNAIMVDKEMRFGCVAIQPGQLDVRIIGES